MLSIVELPMVQITLLQVTVLHLFYFHLRLYTALQSHSASDKRNLRSSRLQARKAEEEKAAQESFGSNGQQLRYSCYSLFWYLNKSQQIPHIVGSTSKVDWFTVVLGPLMSSKGGINVADWIAQKINTMTCNLLRNKHATKMWNQSSI